MAQRVKHLPAMQETRVRFLGQEDPLENGSDSKESARNAGDPGLIPGSGRSPGEEHDNPFQYSCLENSMDRGVWPAAVHGVARVGHDLATKPPPSRQYPKLSPTKKLPTHLPSGKIPYKLMCWVSLVAQTVKRLPAMQETWVQLLGQEDPLEKEMATHSSILA